MQHSLRAALAGLSLLGLAAGCQPSPPAPATTGPAAPRYRVIDLGVAEDRSESFAWAINAPGQVLVVSADPDLERTTTALWEAGQATPLAAPEGYWAPAGFALNEAGEVAGTARGEIEGLAFTFGCVWSGSQTRVFQGPEGESMGITALNAAGTVLGWVRQDAETSRAFRWRAGDLELLPTPPGQSSSASGINDAGLVVGSLRAPDGAERAVLWQDGEAAELSAPASRGSAAAAINRAGLIAGEALGPSGHPRAVLWRDGRMEELGTLGGPASRALALNDRGQVVGSSATTERDETPGDPAPVWHAFVWTDGTMLNLNERIPPDTGWDLVLARGINNHGWIVGEGILEGRARAFLLKPE